MLQNRCDVHTHTLFSRHAYSTVHENVVAARDAGLELLGVTDHFSDMLFPGADLTHADLRDYQYLINTVVWPRAWEGVRLLHGVEADVRTLDGRLFGQDVAVDRDITGGPHARGDHALRPHRDELRLRDRERPLPGASRRRRPSPRRRRCTSARSRGPKVLVLGHAGRAGIPFDVPEVVGEAARQHKLIEINAHSLEARRREGRTWQSCRKIAETCAELGCQIVISSDAHICCDVGGVAPRARDARGDSLPTGTRGPPVPQMRFWPRWAPPACGHPSSSIGSGVGLEFFSPAGSCTCRSGNPRKEPPCPPPASCDLFHGTSTVCVPS